MNADNKKDITIEFAFDEIGYIYSSLKSELVATLKFAFMCWSILAYVFLIAYYMGR